MLDTVMIGDAERKRSGLGDQGLPSLRKYPSSSQAWPQKKKSGASQYGLYEGHAPSKLCKFTCSEVCSGGSRGSLSCMHTVHIHLQVAIFN